MRAARLIALVVTAVAMVAPTSPARAQPVDTWPVTHGIDCLNELFNPIRPDGTRDPAGDPAPGSAAWIERDRQRRECARQRDNDRRAHPHNAINSARYGEDWYRQPARFDGRRFRYTYIAADASAAGAGIPGVPAAEIYRPCAPGDCGSLPAGLKRFAPPYPVVVIFHGFIAQMTHHRFNAQVYAENGYMAIAVNGIHPATGAPNVQSNGNGDEVLNWLASPASGVFGREADLNRVGFVGHSQGAAAALSYQNDARVHAIVAWDGGDSISPNNCTLNEETGVRRPCAPIMYQRTDGEFSAAQTYAASRTDYPSGRNRGLATYLEHKTRGMDVFHLTLRASSHIDWNGNGVGSLAANRLAEPVINYFTLAWLDRHLKGKLAFDADGGVIVPPGSHEGDERWSRMLHAFDAYSRLTAQKFPSGIDVHNISQGFYDPVQHATSGDPLFGGNVPYTIEGLWVTDRLSPEFRSLCSVSVPDYIGGSDGAPGSPVALRADAGAEGDVRLTGCR